MGACCFKPSVSEDVVESSAANSGIGDRGRRANRRGEGATRGVTSDAPGPGNKQICRKVPVWNSDQPMTLGQLLSKRDEFWDTAPAFNGRQEIWQALRAAAECEDTDTAQAIMSAVDVTLPHGNLSLVYDELGNKYDIPVYCLSEPLNLVKNDSVVPPPTTPIAPTVTDTKLPEAPPESPEATPLEEIKVKVRLSTGEQLLFNGLPTTNVSALKHFVQQKSEAAIAPNRQRWLFGGQMLPDSQTLAGAKVPHDAVIQVIIRPEENQTDA